MILVPDSEADVPGERCLVQRHRIAGQFDGDHPVARCPCRRGAPAPRSRPARTSAGGRCRARSCAPTGGRAAPCHRTARPGRRRTPRRYRMIEPTLNGWPTLSSSRRAAACVRRRQPRLSRFTSVMPSWRGLTGAPPARGNRPWPRSGQPAALVRQPALQRVRAQVALDDQVGGGAGGEPAEPGRQRAVQGLLADPDRRVRPDQLKAAGQLAVVLAGGGGHAADVGQPGVGCVPRAQLERPLVDVDRPDPRGRRPAPRVRASGPYPLPRSSRSPSAGGGGAVSSSSLVPGSRRAGENTPESVASVRCMSGSTTCTVPGPVRGGRLLSEVLAAHWC